MMGKGSSHISGHQNPAGIHPADGTVHNAFVNALGKKF